MCTVDIGETLCMKLSKTFEGKKIVAASRERAYGRRAVTTQAEERRDRNDGQSQADQEGVNTNTIALTSPTLVQPVYL